MGTNYYLCTRPDCECCGRSFETLHIGKSSAGWCFSLHVIPEEGIYDLGDWRELWSRDGSSIVDEYNSAISVEEMESIITDRSWPSKSWFDFKANHAEPGPNNLARHIVDGSFCLKHGDGTWDCITGEFS